MLAGLGLRDKQEPVGADGKYNWSLRPRSRWMGNRWPILAETAVLTVAGKKYSAWTSVMLRWIYGGACSDFMFTAAEPVN